jgi:hypothetical protein
MDSEGSTRRVAENFFFISGEILMDILPLSSETTQ